MRPALGFLGLCVLVTAVFGVGVVTQQFTLNLLLDQLDPFIWLIYGGAPFILLGAIGVGIVTMQRGFSASLEREFEVSRDLFIERSQLAERVAERTRDLQIASEVSRQISQVLNLDELLPHLVEQTKDGFELYHVSVFLYDSESRSLILEAGTGEAGRKMKAAGTEFSIDATPSMVSQAGREKQATIITDVSQSNIHFDNPNLPKTRSEAAIPMLLHGELIGVLDLQSNIVDDFSEADLQILTTLAEQIAVAIRNARSYQEQVHLAEELRNVDRMKSQFLSSMSHELRTPLNAIINFVEMVALGMVGPVTDQQKDLLDQSVKSSTHLLYLINDVLDISKIQAGRLNLFIEQDVNLYDELETAIEMVLPLISEKSVHLIKDFDNNLPIIAGDRRRIRQVLLNLLSNAVKFTDEGTITVSAKYQKDRVVFAVIDTGPGIEPDAQAIIFEPFVQTADGIKLEQGTGLGLSISRSLAQAHGGQLWVESDPGQGAAFYFMLPTMQGIDSSGDNYG
jgi:signal transduction histidine kinase